MSEMTSIVEQQLQQQQYPAGIEPGSDKLRCKDCGVNFDSNSSLEVHLHYHQNNLMNQWANQEESNNNSSKAGNHNSGGSGAHVSGAPVKLENCVTATNDTRNPSPKNQRQEQQIPQQQQQQDFGNFQTPMNAFSDTYFMYDEHAHMLSPNSFSSDQPESAGGPAARAQVVGYGRFHPYSHQHFANRTNAINAASPRSPLQCDKCGAICENPNQLAEHMQSNHGTSPCANAYPQNMQNQRQSTPQYQQLAGSPQQLQNQQNQLQAQQQQMITPSPPAQMNQHQQQMLIMPQHQPNAQGAYEFSSGSVIKNEPKLEPEEQAEILDLDSHKVQTHRYEEELRRLQQTNMQHQPELHLQAPHQGMQQHQSGGVTHPVNSIINWPPVSQPHDYHGCISPMGPMDGAAPIQDQPNQFMRSQQHIPQVEPPRHPGSPIVTNAQTISGASLPNILMQQNSRPPALGNQSWKSNEARRPKTYNCTACNKWFTSSGHLKRHYNTTLHKNAVKQSNRPDPANLPISAHHHPARDSNSTRSNAANRNSPETQSSSSPPNLMAGPSGEATRGLLQTPTSNINFNINSSNCSSNSSEGTSIQVSLNQNALQQHQQQVEQQQQAQPLPLASPMLVSSQMYHTQVSPPMAQHHQPQQLHQQIYQSSPSGLQQSQNQHQQLPMGTFSQIEASSHQHMNSDHMPFIQPTVVHASTPSVHQSMDSASSIIPTMVSMASSPPGSMMGGTMMPHQLYPNEQPPHVLYTTKIGNLLDSHTTVPIQTILIPTGDDMGCILSIQQNNENCEMLPGFDIFSNHQQLKLITANTDEEYANRNQVINVGGLSAEENITSPNNVYDTQIPNYDIYSNSSSPYNVLAMQQQTSSPQQSSDEANNNVINNNSAKKNTKNKNKRGASNTGENKDKKIHKCDECRKTFNKACYLTQHNKSFHSGERPFKCNLCGKRFGIQAEHEEHLQKHAWDKPHKCESCPKMFNHKTDLRRHQCLHTGEKPFACSQCGKGFIRKDHMMKHFETHNKKKANNQKVQVKKVKKIKLAE